MAQRSRHDRQPPALVAGGRQGLGAGSPSAGHVRRSVRVAAGGRDRGVGVPGRHDDGAPVVHRVVERQQGRFVAPVRVARRGERRGRLVGERSLGPQRPGGVDELLELGGDVAEPRGRPQRDGIRPAHVVDGGDRIAANGVHVGAPGGVRVDGGVRRELRHAAQPNLGADVARSLTHRSRQRVHVAGRRVVDHCDSCGHDVCSSPLVLWTAGLHGRTGSAGGRSAQPFPSRPSPSWRTSRVQWPGTSPCRRQ